jgi:hypothetical protein
MLHIRLLIAFTAAVGAIACQCYCQCSRRCCHDPSAADAVTTTVPPLCCSCSCHHRCSAVAVPGPPSPLLSVAAVLGATTATLLLPQPSSLPCCYRRHMTAPLLTRSRLQRSRARVLASPTWSGSESAPGLTAARADGPAPLPGAAAGPRALRAGACPSRPGPGRPGPPARLGIGSNLARRAAARAVSGPGRPGRLGTGRARSLHRACP